jgi:hypothetical protein
MRRLIEDELHERATYRRRDSKYGIGAACGREITATDQDGRSWLCAITDTMNGVRWVQVDAPRVPHDWQIEPERIELFVENKAGNFARGSRLDDMAEASPFRIELFLAPS